MDNNFQINFSLKGFTSILIGGYLFIGSYFIETILKKFLVDDNPVTNLSVEIIEIVIIGIVFLVFLLSSLALFFNGKRNAKKSQNPLWNKESKIAFQKYLLVFIIIFVSFFFVKTNYITPTFLILHAILLFVFKNNERKNLLVLSGLSLLLSAMCFLIPSYWASSLSILGIAHIAYGFVIKE